MVDYSRLSQQMGFKGPYYDMGPNDEVYLVLSESTCLKLKRSDGGEMTPENFSDLDLLIKRLRDGIEQTR